MADDPWTILGIPRGADVAAIRHAYAARLKETRPDEDPEAFQRLVQAREAALAAARSRPPAARRPAPEEARPTREEPPRLDPEPAPVPVAVETAPDVLPAAAVLRRPDPAPPRPEEPARDAPILRRAPPAAPAGPVLRPWARPKPRIGDIARWLDEMRGAVLDRAAVVRWQVVLSELSEFALAGRRDLEGSVILALDGILDRAYPLQARSPGDVTLLTVARIATAAADEFGWMTSDRALHEALPPPRPRAFRTRLVELRHVLEIVDEDHPDRKDAQGFPLLSKPDLDSYFGDEAAHYASLLQKARQERDWIAHLDRMALFLGPFWAFQHRRPLLFCAGLLLYVAGALVEHALGRAGLNGPLTLPIALLPPALAHVYLGFYGYRERLKHLRGLARTADRRMLFAPDSRSASIAKSAKRRLWQALLLLAVLVPMVAQLAVSVPVDDIVAAVSRRIATTRSVGAHTLYNSPTRSLTVEGRLLDLKLHPGARPGLANWKTVDEFALGLMQAEAELIGSRHRDEYKLLVKNSPRRPRMRDPPD